jgi:Tfp pilus assembly protein PilV
VPQALVAVFIDIVVALGMLLFILEDVDEVDEARQKSIEEQNALVR